MMDKLDPNDPYGRPARRTQWIVSTLAHHYGLDRGVENEIIVLATGLDQYLQEIFHHMDFQGDGKVPVEDVDILCDILGLDHHQEEEDSESECAEDRPPDEVTFRQFHAKLCGFFSSRAGCLYEDGRLLVGRDSEHIETQIRLRSPLRRRRDKKLPPGGADAEEDGRASGCRHGACTRECYEEIVALEEAEDRVLKLEDENASLRELVEDMRAALQSSDARCLALQVGLWKSHSRHAPEGGCFLAHQQRAGPQSSGRPGLTGGDLKGLQSVVRDMELLRRSRDRQAEEAALCNRRLEEELLRSREEAAMLEERALGLRREQAGMRRKVEEARRAVLSGLAKVRELEAEAGHVPGLQRHVLQLEAELLHYRSEVFKLQLPSSARGEQQRGGGGEGGGGGPGGGGGGAGRSCCLDPQHDRCSPTGRAETFPDKGEEQLFRSVEGQAASDEEEDKWTGEQQRQVDEVKRILTRLSCCGDRCDDKAVRKLMSHLVGSRSGESRRAVLELLEKVTRLNRQLESQVHAADADQDQVPAPGGLHYARVKESLVQELQQKAEETELLHTELQMLETERVRLSLVEDKLEDVLQLLQQLRDLNVSRRSLGKILLSTLESCSDPHHGKAHILEVLNALYHELGACEILSSGGPDQRSPGRQSLSDLIISC